MSIEIGGETRQLRFGQNAWYLFSELYNCSILDVFKVIFEQHQDSTPDKPAFRNPAAIRDAVYCALKAADLAENRVVKYNQYTVGDWIDEAEDGLMESVIKCMIDSQYKPKEKEEEPAEEAKKK
jgi:hypothetical protein